MHHHIYRLLLTSQYVFLSVCLSVCCVAVLFLCVYVYVTLCVCVLAGVFACSDRLEEAIHPETAFYPQIMKSQIPLDRMRK